MKVIIVDDEQFARESISNILNQKFPEITIVAQAGSLKHAIPKIKKHEPDLVFLDIDLTDGTGFDLLRAFDTILFKIIFVTAHNEFAIKAIKYSALDYLLKPVNSEELEKAVNRAKETFDADQEQKKINAFLHNSIAENKQNKKIIIHTSDSFFVVNVDDIIRCESANNYTEFILKDEKKILVSRSLKIYEAILAEQGFVRIHRSHLINLKYITRFEKKEGGSVFLVDEVRLPVSQRKRQELINLIQNYSLQDED